ncbi:MAG: host-nuclease inhibitor Gam family protein [Syntrophobacteraceae bacterium]|nr:host-nuclease inhibitor Gam family protein [Desulfobacteraceae bacterium]
MEPKNWKDVDGILEQMGRLDLEIGIETAGLAEKLYTLVSEHVAELADLKEKRNALELTVNAFCTLHKSEFAKKRSRQLAFGKIAFRVSERMEFPSDLEAVVISTLKRLGHTDCVNVKETVDKTAVKALEDNELTKCGIRRAKEDHFRIEPNLQVVAEHLGSDLPPSTRLDLDKIAKLIPAPDKTENGEEAA